MEINLSFENLDEFYHFHTSVSEPCKSSSVYFWLTSRMIEAHVLALYPIKTSPKAQSCVFVLIKQQSGSKLQVITRSSIYKQEKMRAKKSFRFINSNHYAVSNEFIFEP